MVTSPRFGHSRDIFLLFSEDPAESKDYMYGLVFAGALTLALFACWGIVLIVFRCLGSQSVGFFSGHPVVVDELDPSTTSNGSGGDNVDDGESIIEENSLYFTSPAKSRRETDRSRVPPRNPQYESDEDSFYNDYSPRPPADHGNTRNKQADVHPKSRSRCCNRSVLVRSVFLLCGALYILFAILLVTRGVTDLQNTINTVNDSSNDIDAISAEARDIIRTGLRDSIELASSVRTQLVQELDAPVFCPADPSVQNSDIGRQVLDTAQQAIALLSDLDDFYDTPLAEAESALDKVEKGSAQVQDAVGGVDLTDWRILLVLVPYVVVPALLVAGVIISFFDVSFSIYICVTNWFLLPLFIIMTMVAVGVASGMMIVAGMNSDFCLPVSVSQRFMEWENVTFLHVSNSSLFFVIVLQGGRVDTPDASVYSILHELGYNNTYVYDVVAYFVDQCRDGQDPFAPLKQFSPELVRTSHSDSDAAINLVAYPFALSYSLSLQNTASDSISQLQGSFIDEAIIEELSLYCSRDFTPVSEVILSMDELLRNLQTSLQRALNLLSCELIVPIYTSTVYDGVCTYSITAVYWVFSSSIVLAFSGMMMIMFRAAYKRTVHPMEDVHKQQQVLQTKETGESSMVINEVNPTRRDYNDDLSSDESSENRKHHSRKHLFRSRVH